MKPDAIALFRELAERSPAEREAYYAQHHIDTALRADVESILRFDRSTTDLVGDCVGAVAKDLLLGLTGQSIGNYTLESQIGSGGMGTVWRARRNDGRFEGVAAVKILNAALLGRAAEERFRREGSILARLQHPNIAHILDAGVAPNGFPYIVLEHVEGDHIDRWCDNRTLGVAARIRLFLDVLTAVAHAHANLVVHRDIKPSNVLVSDDGRPKLLDFGIAKLLQGEGDEEQTLLTREGEWALTPVYAAPEQMTGGPVTTATDVYSLGVLLYVLLCGRHPIAVSTHSAADLIRAVVDEDPRRLSASALPLHRDEPTDVAETIAKRRATTPDRLCRTLEGDLETIVGKALKKVPQERYVSATAFADDLHRFLDDRPIAARPDSVTYRTAKFVRRNRVAVAFVAVTLLAITAGVVGTVTQARRATREAAVAREQTTRAEAVRDFLFEVFNEAQPATPGRQPPSVLTVVKDAVAAARANRNMNALARSELLTQLGGVLASQGDVAAARDVLTETFRDAEQRLGPTNEATIMAGRRLAEAVILAGDYERARALLDDLIKRTPPQLTAVRAQLLTFSAYLHSVQRERDPSLAQAQEAVALCRAACAPDDLADALTSLADAQATFNESAASAKTYEEILALERQQYGPSHARVASTLVAFSNPLMALGEFDRAEAMIREALAIDDAVLDRDDHRKGTHLTALIVLLRQKLDYQGALGASREALRIARANFGDDHPEVAGHLNSAGFFLGATGAYRDAADALGEAVRIRERIFGAEHLQTALARGNYGDVLARAGDSGRGEAELRRSIAGYQQAKSKDPALESTMMEKLARWYVDSGNAKAALELYDGIPRVAESLEARAVLWQARAAIGRGRALLLLKRYKEADDALREASRFAKDADLTGEPALELHLARALLDHRLEPNDSSKATAKQALSAFDGAKFQPIRLRRLADELRPEAFR